MADVQMHTSHPPSLLPPPSSHPLLSHPPLSGTPAEVVAIREALDTGADFPPCSIHSLAETLTGLLTSLPQPVIGAKLLPTMELDAQNLRPWTRRFLEQLAPLNYNVFVYLIR